MTKNIVIFSDGTGQEGGIGNNSNVYDLFNMIEDRTRRQISFYDRGLGTGWSRVGAISGAGITRNIKECYQFISDNYSAGDRIFLFGFSRGAATVRTLSAFIHLFGVLPRSRPELIARAWRIYKIGHQDKRRRRAEEFVQRNHTMWARVRLLGVWDTVAALGLPFKALNVLIDKIPFWRHSFHDLRLAESVEYARHAVAIDDERRTFHPQLWDETALLPAGDDPDPFTLEDIGDIRLVAEKLRTEGHPVTKRLQLREETDRLLKSFDKPAERQERERRVEALRRAIVAELNTAVFDADNSVYDPSSDEFDALRLSPATRERMASFRKGRRRSSRRSVRWLDRLLIQDAFSLRPGQIPKIKQVWFAGMHTDVGGGYPDKGLAHVALVWMLKEATDLGLLVYDKHRVDLHPDATGKMHNSRTGLYRLDQRRQRYWDREKNQGRSPLVHESVVVRSRADDPLYEPWILKTDFEVEPWPARLTGSIQYDDHHIWREAFWGGGNAFMVPWGEVERIVGDEQQGTITLYLKDPGRENIVVKGSLPRALSALVTELERRREHERLETEDRRLRQQDETLEGLVKKLEEKVAKLELKEHIQLDDRSNEALEARDKALQAQDRKFRREIEELKAEIEELKRSFVESQPGDDGESSPDVVEH